MKKLAHAEWEGELKIDDRTVYVIVAYDISYVDPGYPVAQIENVDLYDEDGTMIDILDVDPTLTIWDRVELIIDEELKDTSELCA